MHIYDASGGSNGAKVDASNRLFTKASTETEFNFAAAQGRAYVIDSGNQTLTTANESALLYIKNNGDRDLVVTDVYFYMGTSTGGSGHFKVSAYFNPDGGTVVSDATAATVANLNVGNTRTPTGNTYSGAEGKTLTGQDAKLDNPINQSDPYRLVLNFILPRGAAVGFGYTPPSSNTSQVVAVEANVYEREL